MLTVERRKKKRVKKKTHIRYPHVQINKSKQSMNNVLVGSDALYLIQIINIYITYSLNDKVHCIL